MPTLQKENPPRIYKYATDIMDIKKTVSSTFSYLELTLDIHHMNLLIHLLLTMTYLIIHPQNSDPTL